MTIYSPAHVPDIATLPVKERPRERLILNGPQGLSDHELLTVFLGSGSRHSGVSSLALDLLQAVDATGPAPVPNDLVKIKGIGGAKASQLCALLEFAKRRFNPTKKRIQQPSDVLSIVGHFQDRPVEHFLALSLNGAHELIALRIVSIGLVNRTIVHPREVYADAIVDRATALVVCHNHPSGNLDPSEEDSAVTGQLKEAGEILGIKLLDHVIFSANGYYSFLEDRKL
jgi:DNA repair protein RadC